MKNNENIVKLILIRHGESQWNKENRFTGWMDIDLSDHGKHEAKKAGEVLKNKGYFFEFGYSSVLKRAIHTLWIILDEIDQTWLPVKKLWQLNERHYGALQGMNKQDVIERYGAEQVTQWRRSFLSVPPKTDIDDLLLLRNDPRYVNLNFKELPSSESLSMTVDRIRPCWNHEIVPHIKNHKKLIISVHGNTVRAIIKLLTGMNEHDIFHLNIPTGIPVVCEFTGGDAIFIKYYYLSHAI